MSGTHGARLAPDYRPDIDGLRALAVIAVILFHARIPGFGGGFVGVDVFFVISGFLITQLLLVRSGQPFGSWLGEFYLRRARRILPALLLVMTVTTAAALWLFTPVELKLYGQALARCVAMLANLAALRMGGYFDTPWAITPLQHLWSIAVEEQFYVAYPLALFLVLRFVPARARLATLALATLASFALCAWGSVHRPHLNYYLPMTRAWELLAGAMLAMHGIPPLRSRLWRDSLGMGGLLLIGVAVVAYDNTTPFPGWYALPPCIGAAALIAAGGAGGSLTNRLLAWRPLVFIGLLSYSLYLWHAPVQVFWRYYMVVVPDARDHLVQLALIFALAFASWRWVETPLRRRELIRSNKTFLRVMAASVAVLFALGLYLWRSPGLPGRFSAEEKRLMLATHLPDQSVISCMARIGPQVAAGDLCSFGTARRPQDVVVLWGDSHALTLLPAVREIAARRGEQVRFGALSSCRPLTGALSSYGSMKTQQRCLEFNLAMAQAVENLQPSLVILTAYWRFPNAEPAPLPSLGGNPADPLFSRALEDAVARIRASGRRICLVRDVPDFPFDVAHALAMARRRGIAVDFNSLTRAQAVEQQRFYDAQFDQLERRGLFRSVNLREVLCASGHCRMQDDLGTPLYSDTHHLTIEGARFVEGEVEKCFD
jgi:peptidoglycan/LPS O-acetylase OafA/YrhL